MPETRQKIRILHIVSRLRHHGPISQLYNLIKHMDRRAFSNAVLTLSPEAEDSLLPEFHNLDIGLYSLGLSRSTGILLGRRLLREFLVEHPVDVIHASDIRSSIIAAIGPQSTPRVITRREAFHRARRIDHGIVFGTVVEMIHSAACRRADRVVTVSRCVREAASGIEKSNIEVIPNGVDTEKFTPASETGRRELRNSLRLPQEKRLFVSVGFLSNRKDPLTAIRGFLSSKIAAQSMLLLLGDGPLRKKCEELTDGRPNVRLIGFTNNVLEYLQTSDFFVLSSLFEGYPNAAMEALACGLPVILSDIGPHREIMELNTRAGILFTAKDAGSLAERMEEMHHGDYSLLRKSALDIARKHLSARRMSMQYERLYKELYETYSRPARRIHGIRECSSDPRVEVEP